MPYEFPRDSLWLLYVKYKNKKKQTFCISWKSCRLTCRLPREQKLLLHERAYHTATVLPNGAILVVGGRNRFGEPLNDACFLRKVTTSDKKLAFEFTRSALIPPAWRSCWSYHSATLVMGSVYVIGKLRPGQSTVAVYNCATEQWSMQRTVPAGNHSMGSHRAVRVGSHIVVLSLDRTDLNKFARLRLFCSDDFFPRFLVFSPTSTLSSETRLHCSTREAVDLSEPWRNEPSADEHYLYSLTTVGDKIVLCGGRHFDGTPSFRNLYCLRLTL